jgi:ATP-binding cassette subfamily C (CFTR/MRP) protein 4
MTAVERILEYCSLDQEPLTEMPSDHSPEKRWPSNGRITFENVSMRHSPCEESPLSLRHISFTIEAGENVGIVGRTGAGKTSLIQTLFRMSSLVEGRIIIDDIDITTVRLDHLRRGISIIPQEPVLFTGSLRSNLDEFRCYSDAEVWHALEQVSISF